jgi:hypothetical protein
LLVFLKPLFRLTVVSPDGFWHKQMKTSKTRLHMKIKNRALLMSLIAVGSLSWSVSAATISGTGLDDSINTMIGYGVSGAGSSAKYVAAAGSIPAYGALYTPNASVGGPTAAIWVGDETAPNGGGIPGTLSSLNASYTLLSSGIGPGPGNFAPYWVLWMADDTGFKDPIVSTSGGPLNGSSLIHVGNLTHGSITLSELCGDIDPNSGLLYALETVAWVGLEIGNGGSGPASANIESITISSVPDGGMTVTLLGGSLMGLAAFRRKLAC